MYSAEDNDNHHRYYDSDDDDDKKRRKKEKRKCLKTIAEVAATKKTNKKMKMEKEIKKKGICCYDDDNNRKTKEKKQNNNGVGDGDLKDHKNRLLFFQQLISKGIKSKKNIKMTTHHNKISTLKTAAPPPPLAVTQTKLNIYDVVQNLASITNEKSNNIDQPEKLVTIANVSALIAKKAQQQLEEVPWPSLSSISAMNAVAKKAAERSKEAALKATESALKRNWNESYMGLINHKQEYHSFKTVMCPICKKSTIICTQ